MKVSLGGNPLTVKVTLEGTVEDKATELVMTINVPGVGDVKAEFTGAIEYVPSDLAELLSIEFADNAKVAVQPATTDGKNYTFAMTADATADDLKGLVPTIVVSEMATVVPASNKTVDFSQGAVDFVRGRNHYGYLYGILRRKTDQSGQLRRVGRRKIMG